MNREQAEKEAALQRLTARKKLIGMLGLCIKAGKAIVGAELVCNAVRAASPGKTPHTVFLASDTGANTKKRVSNCCRYYEVPCRTLQLDGAALGEALGKTGYITALGITDRGMAEAIVARDEALGQTSPQTEARRMSDHL